MNPERTTKCHSELRRQAHTIRKLCHAELVSASLSNLAHWFALSLVSESHINKTLKQVQGDSNKRYIK